MLKSTKVDPAARQHSGTAGGQFFGRPESPEYAIPYIPQLRALCMSKGGIYLSSAGHIPIIIA